MGQLRVMGRHLVNTRNNCCGGSLLSYRIGTLLAFLRAPRQPPARGGSHASLTHGLMLLKWKSFLPDAHLSEEVQVVACTFSGLCTTYVGTVRHSNWEEEGVHLYSDLG